VVGDPSINGGTSGNAGAGNVIVAAPTSTLSINRSDTFDFTGTLSGPGALAQIGAGTTRLTAAGSSIGTVEIDAGTLQVDGDLTAPAVTMNGSSTLTVNGTVGATGGGAATLTGGSGASTLNVNAGATFRANGDLGDGDDTVNIAGTLATGAASLDLGAGDDVVILNDGASITGLGLDAGSAATADLLVLSHVDPLAFDGGLTAGFERLAKQGAGTATMTGTQTFTLGATIEDGTLAVDAGAVLVTAAVDLHDDATLDVAGTLEAAGGAPATITG